MNAIPSPVTLLSHHPGLADDTLICFWLGNATNPDLLLHWWASLAVVFMLLAGPAPLGTVLTRLFLGPPAGTLWELHDLVVHAKGNRGNCLQLDAYGQDMLRVFDAEGAQ